MEYSAAFFLFWHLGTSSVCGFDPAAAEEVPGGFVVGAGGVGFGVRALEFVVDDEGLAWGDGVLGLFEADFESSPAA